MKKIGNLSFLERIKYEELDEPICNADFVLNTSMNKVGIQIEIRNSEGNTTKRNTMTWEEFDK